MKGGVTSLCSVGEGEERKSGERLKLNAAETKNDRVMTAPGLNSGCGYIWVRGRRRAERGPCDYPSTNSRAQSGHHGPEETCNHAVLQHLSAERGETLWFRILHEYAELRSSARSSLVRIGLRSQCMHGDRLLRSATDEPVLITNDS